MKRYICYINFLILLCIAASCKNSDNSHQQVGIVEGVVNNAEGELLLIEHIGAGKPVIIDSLRLNAQGKFVFKSKLEKGPDFFCLRIKSKFIPIVFDSLNTFVEVNSDWKDGFASSYSVSNDLNAQIKTVSNNNAILQERVLNVNLALKDGRISAEIARDSIESLITSYKNEALENYIYVSPASPISYYLLFQRVAGVLLFDPLNPIDNRAFGAVATSWKYNYPQSPRCKSLEKLTLEGLALRKMNLQNIAETDSLMQSKVEVREYFDIVLPNFRDEKISLSSIVDTHKKIVLLDFTSYALSSSAVHNMKLADVYEKFKHKGIEIYQVCIDIDENFWKVGASNVPWIAVRDKETNILNDGSIYSVSASMYNVSKLPITYVFNQEGSIVSRVEDDTELESIVKSLIISD